MTGASVLAAAAGATVGIVAGWGMNLRDPVPELHQEALLDAAGPARALPDDAPVFDGLFIQPDVRAGFTDPARREADLRRAAEAGVRTIVLQYASHGDFSMVGPWQGGDDPIGALLDQAHALGMEVWLGTHEHPPIWDEAPVRLRAWSEAAERGVEVAADLAEAYGDHPGFAGWYWTPEVVWPEEPDGVRLSALSRISARAVDELRDLHDRPVAVVLGPTGFPGEKVQGRAWCRYLRRVRPDRVVVMDGVGTGHLPPEELDRLYATLRGCGALLDFELIADVEVFSPGGGDAEPAMLERQHAAARAGADRVFAFDLPHYLAEDRVAAGWWARRSRPDPEPP